MSTTLALVGNPNSGKTTMFNDLTGSNQYVGNWPGVTVEKKEGALRGAKDILIQDLPGIYSLSPYTLEEVITRNYLIQETPDVIINIVDASNIERNLYLTTQLLEFGLPVVVALNMIDLVRKQGDVIDVKKLSEELGCTVVETSATKGIGSREVAQAAAEQGAAKLRGKLPAVFRGTTEHAVAHIEDILGDKVPDAMQRWYAIKLFERDRKVADQLGLTEADRSLIEAQIVACEEELDDDCESIITNERYDYISKLVKNSVKKKSTSLLRASDRVDNILTNRWLALPIFALIMFTVYYFSVTSVGAVVTDFSNETLFGNWILPNAQALLESWQVAPWLTGLIVGGVINGVGAVLGFVPQMFVLFFFLAILEDCGYMSRVAFIMDKLFRRLGLSGKSFIPMLVGTGCGVPGIMASRTIESEKERRMTIMTTTFIPCGAKMPIVALIAGAVMGGRWWVAPSAYLVGIAAVVLSGLILKKTTMFSGDSSPFVMELPPYHLPTVTTVLRSVWERGWSFIKRAGSVVLVASVLIWLMSNFGVSNGSFGMVADLNHSILASVGNSFAWLFAPLGFGFWQAAVATILGLLAKEEVVGVFGVLYGIAGDAMELVESGSFDQLGNIGAAFTALSGYSFLIFNLLCAPCFAAMGAIRREMNNPRWTLFAIGYQTGFAYCISLMVYQVGLLLSGGGLTIGTLAAATVFVMMGFLLVRSKQPSSQTGRLPVGG